MDASLRARAEQLASEMASQATTVQDLNGLMRLMMKSALERMLDTEMDVHLGRRPATATAVEPPAAELAPATEAAVSTTRPPNRRNGRSQKTVQGDQGELTIATPRDRAGTFEPQLIGKHQRRVPGFDEKILALYAKGMTTRDIQDIVQQLCIVHLVRAALRYVSTSDSKAVIADLKAIYLAIHEASKKWTMPIRHWKTALNHFAILFEDRLPQPTSK